MMKKTKLLIFLAILLFGGFFTSTLGSVPQGACGYQCWDNGTNDRCVWVAGDDSSYCKLRNLAGEWRCMGWPFGCGDPAYNQ
jgi:hypothetical protein